MIATNRVDVREYLIRREEQTHGPISTTGEGRTKKLCPVCQVNGLTKVQTKEHLLAGDCSMTKTQIAEMTQEMETHIKKWKLPQNTQQKVIQLVKTQWQKVDTQNMTADIQTHIDSGELVGLWKDSTIQKAQAIVRQDKEDQEQYIKSQMINLSSKLIKTSAEIYRNILFYKEAMTTVPTQAEIELHKKLQKERPVQLQREWIREMTQAQVRNIINRHFMITGYVIKRALTANERVEEQMQDWRQKKRLRMAINLTEKVKKRQQEKDTEQKTENQEGNKTKTEEQQHKTERKGKKRKNEDREDTTVK